MPKYGNAWLELALEIVRAANERMSLSSFLAYQKLALPQAGKGIRDRQRVLKVILDLGIVDEVNGILVLGSPRIPDWLSESLIDGNESAWGIVQQIDPSGNLARKFDDTNLKRIGELGELAVISELKKQTPADMHAKIQKVSDHDDMAGYDVRAPKDKAENFLLLEVKTTSRPVSESFSFFLSRNEAQVGDKSDNWFLVATTISNAKTAVIGHVTFEALRRFLPIDSNHDSEWQSVRITIKNDEILIGLPTLDF